jgi:carbon-monoxide dehydrogenase iron sulfur subunit
VDYERCTGCRNCEMACSVFHVQACNPAKSAVRIVKREREGLNVPIVCQQCEEPACAGICPVQAISRDADTDAGVLSPGVCASVSQGRSPINPLRWSVCTKSALRAAAW